MAVEMDLFNFGGAAAACERYDGAGNAPSGRARELVRTLASPDPRANVDIVKRRRLRWPILYVHASRGASLDPATKSRIITQFHVSAPYEAYGITAPVAF
jgi:hypothetical protein